MADVQLQPMILGRNPEVLNYLRRFAASCPEEELADVQLQLMILRLKL